MQCGLGTRLGAFHLEKVEQRQDEYRVDRHFRDMRAFTASWKGRWRSGACARRSIMWKRREREGEDRSSEYECLLAFHERFSFTIRRLILLAPCHERSLRQFRRAINEAAMS